MKIRAVVLRASALVLVVLILSLVSLSPVTRADEPCSPVPTPTLSCDPGGSKERACRGRWNPDTCECREPLACDLDGSKERRCREQQGAFDPEACDCRPNCDPDGSKERQCRDV